jgi:glycosyltransferase involved in cell wall biosynthesis
MYIRSLEPEISVLVCSHNPRQDYLQRVLDALKAQTLSREAWELVLVDNASDARLADSWDLGWHPRARHIREEELGLTPARRRAISEARASLLVFVDDDNVLGPDYLEHVVSIAGRCDHLGVFGAGTLVPEFERNPVRELRLIGHVLALRTVSSERWSNHLSDVGSFPWGAGLCARKDVALRFVDLVQRLNVQGVLGRKGKQLLCGEDDLFSWASAAAGRGFGVFPQLRITHLVPAERVDDAYLLRWIRGHAYSHGVLGFLLKGERPSALTAVDGARMLVHGIRDGLFAMRCDLARVTGTRDATTFITQNRLTPLSLPGPTSAPAS